MSKRYLKRGNPLSLPLTQHNIIYPLRFQIAAIQNSSGYRIAIRKNARVNPNGKLPR